MQSDWIAMEELTIFRWGEQYGIAEMLEHCIFIQWTAGVLPIVVTVGPVSIPNNSYSSRRVALF